MKKLKRKITFVVFLSTLGVFILTVLLTGVAMQFRVMHSTDEMTELINNHGGAFPDKKEYDTLSRQDRIFFYDYDEESPYRMRYFVVYFNTDEPRADVSHIVSVDEETAVEMASYIKAEGNIVGYYEDFRYRNAPDTDSVIFLDASAELDNMKTLLVIITLVAMFFTAIITIVFRVFSERVVRPFEENARMQKQFITDASHELKTPLAIISANAEVLAYKDGKNEWISNITEQVERIGGLINELLTLNRLEEIEENGELTSVDLSEILTDTCDDFAEVFQKSSVHVETDISKNVTLNANLEQLKRLCSVLIENAAKYVTEGGNVRVLLKKELRHVTLSVFNTCEIDESVDYSHLFERFYRPDASRTSKTGGHGIGLSIARRIADLHGGSIEAKPAEDGLWFIVTLSSKLK